MIGAIAGDIIGSVYEWHNIKTKAFELFSPECTFTDDSVMTVAVALALLRGGAAEDYIHAMQLLGRRYPDAGYGGRFSRWLRTSWPKPYNSYGNGSAMRVSPVAWYFDTLDEVERAAEASAAVTHNHPEGIKGAQAAAAAAFLARAGADKAAIRAYIEGRYRYDLHRRLDDIRPGYGFDVSCQGSVPQAIIAFLESTDYEDAIRNAVSIGGDSDTIAAIAGGIAEAAYGVPDAIRAEALRRLTPTLRDILARFEAEVSAKGGTAALPDRAAGGA